MKSLLVTVVGRGRSPGDGSGRYVATPYAFREGGQETIRRATFFGVALFGYLAERGRAPDLLLVGTEGSSWDYLEDFFVSMEKDPPPGWDVAFRRLEEEVKAERVTQETLDGVLGRLGEALGVQVSGVVLSNSPAPKKVHQAFLDALRALYGFSGVQELHLDITHGYRHLGFVLLASALALRHIWGCHIALHYGGLEMRSPEGEAAPVVDLGLVGRLMDLDEALGVLQTVGDFRPYYALEEDLAGQAEAAYLRVETNQ